jgi:plastocyanin
MRMSARGARYVPNMTGRTLRIVAATSLACATLIGIVDVANATPRATRTTTITVEAGINDPRDPNVVVTEFLPARVTVPVGATIDWSWARAIEPHSVTFFPEGTEPPPPGSDQSLFLPTPPNGPLTGAALVNSGLQPLGPATPPAFAITFDDEGTFPYFCVIHPNMVGTVNVVDEGAKVDTRATVKARAVKEQKRWLAEGRAAKRKLLRAEPASTRATDGTSTWDVEMGATTPHTDILAFAPVPTRVKAGDRVQFVNNSQAPHTATFAGTQPPIENPLAPEASTAIPGPSPQILDTTNLFNTGELAPEAGDPPPPLAARSFTFVVPSAGKYPYYCILHVASGMSAEVEAS